MAEDWCDHCDLPKSQCVHGRPEKVDLPLKAGPTIEASQTSPCGYCPNLIEPGQSITMSDEGWVHTEHLSDRSWPGEVRHADVPSRPPETDTSMFDGID